MANPSHSGVWRLALPIILSNISVPLVGAVDTAVVGRLDNPDAMGGVALGALIFGFMYWSFSFLRMGTGGFVAQAHGAGLLQTKYDTLLRGMLVAAALGVTCIVVASPLIDLALGYIESSATVNSLTRDYASIRLWSAPAVLGIYVLSGYMVGVQSMRYLLLLQLVLNITNMLLDILFVLGLGWGIEGVAVASVLAEYLALLYGLIVLRQPVLASLQNYSAARIFDAEALRQLLKANFNIFVRTLCLQIGFGYFTISGARQSEVILAANAILMHLMHIVAHGLDGFATAVEALAGAAYGARDRQRFRQSVVITTLWSAVLAVVASMTYLLFGSYLVSLFTTIDAVVQEAVRYLPWMVIAPIISVWSYQLDGIFIGAGRTREMRNAMLLSVCLYLLALQWLVPEYGNHGLFAGLMFFMLLRGLTMAYYYPQVERSLLVNQTDSVNSR